MGIFDFLDPPAARVQSPQMQGYNPTGQPLAENALLGGIGNLGGFNLYGQQIPEAGAITRSLIDNPYAGNFMTGANYASNMGMLGANNAFGAGGNLYGMGGQIANTAFDPQNDLYARTLQQIQDQTRAGQAARGIQTTPYGAGLEDQATRNFNIDWQNQQLQRQIAGGGAAGSLFGQGAGLQMQAPGQYLTAAGLPYGTYQGIGQNQFGALSNLGQFGQQAGGQAQQPLQDWQNYLGWGTQSNQVANTGGNQLFQNQLNQANQGFQQQQTMFGGLGQAAGAIAPYAMAMFSDERVKDDIVPVGELYDRTPVYSYRYKGDPVPRIGLLAQDVEKRRPDAVFDVGGVKAVDYGRATEWSRGIAALSAWS